MNHYDKVKRAVDAVREITSFVPEIAIVLGSGLGAFADEIEVVASIPSENIPGYGKSTVSGHVGRLVFGYFAGKPIVVQQGRIHYYEGYTMGEVVFPIRLMCSLGAKKVILTNAAGGINKEYASGDFMAITGQIAQFVPSPLVGENDESFGERFPDMSSIYSGRLIDIAKESAKACGAVMHEGVYVQASGPNYESPEEIKMFRICGADAVGMSTAVEAIAAKHMGREILGMSLIANPAAGVSSNPLNHESVKAVANQASEKFLKILEGTIRRM